MSALLATKQDAGLDPLLPRLAALLSHLPDTHIVGGFLRDSILARPSYDVDLTVAGDALAVARRLAADLGGAFVLLDESNSVARVVVQQSGHAWQVDVASRQGDVLHDLGRRDFTIDAMTLPLQSFQEPDWRSRVLDPFGGVADLERKRVRAVSDSVFREDGVRLLRAVRLAAHLDFEIDGDTKTMAFRDSACLAGVSGERIRDEFLAVLSAGDALQHVYLLDELDLLGRIVPVLETGRGVTQPKEHYWDVFHHNVETVGTVEGLLNRTLRPPWVLEQVPWSAQMDAYFSEVVGDGHTRATLLKLAGLLHDIAKPAMRTVDDEGRIRFIGHHSEGAVMAAPVLHGLRMSRRTTRAMEAMIDHHLRPGQMSQAGELPTARAVYRFFRSAGDVAIDTLYLNLADYLSARGPLLEREEWAAYAGKVSHILDIGLSQAETPSTPRLVNGRDLMAELDLSPGPLLGRLLDAIGEAQAAGEIASREQALSLARDILGAEMEGSSA